MTSRQPVIVVGAGIAGLACARVLADGGRAVVVLERGRGVGGRMATRRVEGQPVDLGAQYVTATDPAFEALLRRLAATGRAEPWATRLHRFERGRVRAGGPDETGRVRWAFPQGMTTLPEDLAAGLQVRRQVRVAGLAVARRSWLVRTPSGGHGAGAVVLALPAPEAVELIEDVPGLAGVAKAAREVRYDPCWALAAGYPDAPPPTWRGMFVRDDPTLAWLAHDSSKRPDPRVTVLVAHASGAWSRRHVDAGADEVTRALVAAGARVAGRWAADPTWTAVRHWRFAQLTAGVDDPWLLAGGHAPVGLCGDWCAGPKVEGAWRSGRRLGAALLERLA